MTVRFDAGVSEGEARKTITLESTLRCPSCGALTPETMPVDACRYFYECPVCTALLKPKPGDCCVFCSYGSVPCPPVQKGDGDDCCKV